MINPAAATRMPALFISHGAPDIAIRPSPANAFLKSYAAELPRPRAILVVSAHWETATPQVATNPSPPTIYDFGGFDRRLNAMTYPAPGAPDVSRRAATLLREAGLTVTEDAAQGYDHGVWTPLALLYPQADIPIAQVSMQPAADPAHHLRLGRALEPLRDEGVLIIGSGAMTHNLGAFFGRGPKLDGTAWVAAFVDWMADRLADQDIDALLDYRRRAPHAVDNHPDDEHLLPLYVPLGAWRAGEPIHRVHTSIDRDVIAMDVYRFG